MTLKLTAISTHPKVSTGTNSLFMEGYNRMLKEIGVEKKMNNSEYNPDDYKFETLGEFKIYLSCGANVGFEYNGIEYGIEGHDNSFDIWIYGKGDIANKLTLEEVLDYKLYGVKIRELILDAEITERIM